MKYYVISLIFIAALFNINGQTNDELFMPLEFQYAYEQGTRNKTGAPGENYWQNTSYYTIDAVVNPEDKTIQASAEIFYKNNSPDTLRIIVIRLYHDLYKKGNARDREINSEDITKGVDLSNISIGGQTISLDDPFTSHRSGTNLFMRLPESLLPNDSVGLSLDWQTTIPDETLIRMGAIDESTMFVAYWYPQISVYDDIDGWDHFDYGSQQEFYQDLADFDVSLTVPADYLVWATGDLQEPQAIYQRDVINKLEQAKQSDEIIRIVDNPRKSLKTSRGQVVWNFKTSNVPDFAFALSDHYVWDASSVMLDSSSRERVMVHTVYNQHSAKRYKHITEQQRQSLLYFSYELPGSMYPFHKFITFQGLKSGGMEFPMMANNGDYTQRNDTLDLILNLEVTAHEIAHSYVPFHILVNERKYTWMEEGWATMFGERATSHIQTKTGLGERYNMKNMYDNRFYSTEGTQFSVPLMTPTIIIKNRNTHFHISYYKAYYAYNVLEHMLGKEVFRHALQVYFNRWKGKHPTPYDFFYTFNDATGQNLNWFWKPWFFNFRYPDLAVENIENNQITISNKGQLPVPVGVRVIFDDNTMKIYQKSAEVWKSDMQSTQITVESEMPVKSAEIIWYIVPDVNFSNNKME